MRVREKLHVALCIREQHRIIMAQKRPLEPTGSERRAKMQKSMMACLYAHHTDVTFIVGPQEDRYTANSHALCLRSEV